MRTRIHPLSFVLVFFLQGFIAGVRILVIGLKEKFFMIFQGGFVPASHVEGLIDEVVRVFIIIGHQCKIEKTDAKVVIVFA